MNSRCLARLLGTVVTTVALSLTAFAAPAELDSSFGANGRVTTDFDGRNDVGTSLAVQSDGKIVVAGYSFNGSNDDVALVRYHADGTLDDSFGTGGRVTTDIGGSDDGAYSVAVQSDGKIVVTGYVSGSNLDIGLVRYHADGSLDHDFGIGGKVITDLGGFIDVGHSVAVRSDGKIVVAGDSFTGDDSDFVLLCYHEDGTLDDSFGTGGIVTTDFSSSQDRGRSVAIQSDGKILVAGISGTYPASDMALVRYDADGTLDDSFGTGGKVITDFGGSDDASQSVVVQSDGKILVGGYSLIVSYAFALVRYDEDGTLDSDFGTGGKVITPFGGDYDLGQSVAVQGDGKILVAGYSSLRMNDEGFALARYTASGVLDNRFGTGGKVITDFGSAYDVGRSLVLQSDGKIVVAGYSGSSPNCEFALVRYLGGELPTAPEMEVQYPIGTRIANGGRMDLGSVSVGSATDFIFIIANPGTADLTLTGLPDLVAVDGANANLFTVTTPPISPVAAEGTTTFIVRFTPASIGTSSATLTITSNDALRSPFTVTLDATAQLGAPVNTPVLLAGGTAPDAAPGAGVFPGLPADAKLASFNAPATDDDGDLAYIAKWVSATGGTNGKPTKGTGLFLNDDCLAVIGGDASALAGTGTTFKSFSDPVVDVGRIAGLATLAGAPKATSAVVLSNAQGSTALEIVARANDIAPLRDGSQPDGGAKFESFKAASSRGGSIAVFAQLASGTTEKVTAGNDLALYLKNFTDELKLALREGDPVEVAPGVSRTIKSMVSFAGGADSPGQGRGWHAAPYNFTVLALVTFTDKSQAVVSATSGGPQVFALSGPLGPGPAIDDAEFASFGLPATVDDDSYTAAFLASMKVGFGGVTKADARAVFISDGTGRYTPVARIGFAAGTTGATFSVLKDPVLAKDDRLAFTATLKGGGLKPPATASLWSWRNGTLDLLAQGGTDAGDLPGAKWKAFTSLAIAAGRGPIFTATLLPNKTNVSKASATGVWACDSNADPRLLFRTGIPNAIINGKTLKSFTLLKATVGSTGVTRSFNNTAQVVWLATFTDKTTALITTHVP